MSGTIRALQTVFCRAGMVERSDTFPPQTALGASEDH